MLREPLRKGELCIFTEEPLDQARGEAEGALGTAVSHKFPLEPCVDSVQNSVHAPGKGVFASAAKQLPLLKMLLVNHDLITL